jgi:phenylacetic acid degradation protein
MDNAVIGESSIVAASAFVKASQVIPPRTLVAGVPAKIIRPLSEEEMAWKSDGTRTYQDLTKRCLATMVETSPLSAVEPGRKRIEMPDVVPLTELKNRDK